MIDLAQKRLGSKVVYKTDEFFAKASRINESTKPIFIPNKFDIHGKWMDGWETRRKRDKGHDYLIIHLGKKGIISKINIDTTHFNGNQPSFASIEACYNKKNIPSKKVKWKTILSKKKIKPDSHNIFSTTNRSVFTHIKLNIMGFEFFVKLLPVILYRIELLIGACWGYVEAFWLFSLGYVKGF